MNRLVRLYNQNRKKIWLAILIIIAFIVFIQVLDKLVESENKKAAENYIETNNSTIASETQKQYSAVTKEKKDDTEYKNQTEIISQFIDKCNEGDTEGAYDLLSDNCKQALYPSINLFIDGYYNKYFEERKSYNYKVWTDNTYKIELRTDILSTGIYSDSFYVEDYYTVENRKLNIEGFVKKQKVNKNIEKNKIKITLIDIDYFRDYAIANIQVFNKTDNTILLDSRNKEWSVYLVDKNNLRYDSFIEELNEEEINFLKGEQKDINIKFNFSYRSSVTFEKLIFKNIILDYDKYIADDSIQENAIELKLEI